MLRFVVDENFDQRILKELHRLRPDFDAVRVQDIGLGNTDDRVILEWASQNERILLTHDIATMTNYARERIANGLHVAGIILVHETAPIGRVLEDIQILLEVALPEEWDNRLWYVPL